MKVWNLPDVIKCPVCGAKPVLRKNASKDFQVACSNKKCEYRTAWRRKTEAVIAWYNMTLQMWRNQGKLQKD